MVARICIHAGILGLFLCALLAPLDAAYAQGTIRILPQCPTTGCRACDLVKLANNLMEFIIFMSVIIAVLLIMFAGVQYVLGGGSSHDLLHLAGSIVGGIVLMLCGWLIVDTFMKYLVGNQKFGVWNDIQCVDNPPLEKFAEKPPSATPVDPGGVKVPGASEFGGVDAEGNPTTPTSSSTPQGRVCSGEFSPEALQSTFGQNAAAMSCIIRGESTCQPGRLSSTDTLGRVPLNRGGIPFSAGLYQINLTVHDMNQPACRALNGGQPLNCTQAFTGGRNYSATLANRALYDKCISAAQNVECSTQVAQSLVNNRSGLNNWSAYSQCR